MGKKKSFISIIISANNNLKLLKRCLDSFSMLNNVEFIIINNKIDENEEVEKYLYKINDHRIVYYQSTSYLTLNKSRNLGLNIATGSWIYFINDCDIATEKFVKFLLNSRLDHRIDFYRLQIISEKDKKIRFSIPNSKFYSDNISTFLIKNEWINKVRLRFEDDLIVGDTLTFINKLYTYKNVNYFYLKGLYAIYHDFSLDMWENLTFENNSDILLTLKTLMNKKEREYKQFITLLIYKVYKSLYKGKQDKEILFLLKEIKNKANIWILEFIKLRFCFFIKTIKLRFLLFNTHQKHDNNSN